MSVGPCASRPRPAICHHICALFQHCFNSLVPGQWAGYFATLIKLLARMSRRVIARLSLATHIYEALVWHIVRGCLVWITLAVSARLSEYRQVLDYRFPSAYIRERDRAELPHVATPYLRTHTKGRAHMSRTDRDFARAHTWNPFMKRPLSLDNE